MATIPLLFWGCFLSTHSATEAVSFEELFPFSLTARRPSVSPVVITTVTPRITSQKNVMEIAFFMVSINASLSMTLSRRRQPPFFNYPSPFSNADFCESAAWVHPTPRPL